MKVLLLYDYPPSPSGLATQGYLLHIGLQQLGVEVYSVHQNSDQEKEWYYSWFKPDIVVGIGYWGNTPELILHPRRFGMLPVPWLVADGYIADHQNVLNELPLILVTSNWVKDMYIRDGIRNDNIQVLPVGCDTDAFIPTLPKDPKILAVRLALGIRPDQLMILTVGGDAASKGGREVMEALSQISDQVPDYKYVCKVWPQPRTELQTLADKELVKELGLTGKVIFATNTISRNFVPYLVGACDIYAAPSRLEGFGMIQVEAGACGKPVIGMKAMGMLDTLIHGKTAYLAGIGEEIVAEEVVLTSKTGSAEKRRIVFDKPRTVDYRADINDISTYLKKLMNEPQLRTNMGAAARQHVIAHFDFRVVAKQFLTLVNKRLGTFG